MGSSRSKKICAFIFYLATTHCLNGMELSEKLTELAGKLAILKIKLSTLQTKLVELNERLTKKPLPIRCSDYVYGGCLDPIQMSCKTNEKISAQFIDKSTNLLDAIPMLGRYGANNGQYSFRNRLCLLELNTQSLEKSPASIIQAIAAKLGVVSTSFAVLEKIKNDSIIFYFYVVIHGQDENKIKYMTVNMVFHPLLERNLDLNKKHPGDGVAFIENVSMGIFDYDGVIPDDIGNNALKEISVHYHDACYSPNNAAFNLTGGRSTGSFWSVAIPQNPKVISVTYHLLINQEDITERLNAVFSNVFETNNLDDVFNHLETEKAKMAQEIDRKTIDNFIGNLKKITG